MPKKKKDMSWDQIGKAVGKKMEKYSKENDKDGNNWCKSFSVDHQVNGGGFGRLLFISSILYAMNLTGMLEGIPLWTLVLIAIGFAMMRL
ncbi:MAG: hypothetical protein GOV02_03445 [Candidatus Aenigmarchaeota archaeon]|nr:hypothetical protein [Candidatus Aenigmarchaeota archaeon]